MLIIYFQFYLLKGLIYIGKNLVNKRLGIGTSFKSKHKFATRSLLLLVLFTLCFIGLLGRIGYIQFVKGAEYKTAAYKNQVTSQTIASKRGTIYDSTNKILAISSAVDTISINLTAFNIVL